MCTVQKDYLQGRGKKTKGGGAGDDAAAAFDKGRIFDRCVCWHRDAQKPRVMKGRAAHSSIRVCSPARGTWSEENGRHDPCCVLEPCYVLLCSSPYTPIFWGVRCRV